MVFNNLPMILLILITVWCVILTVYMVSIKRRFDALAHGSDKESLSHALDHLLKGARDAQGDIESLRKEIIAIQHADLSHFQRLGIVRFNPFSDTGGTQSFTMAFLDGKNTGLVMTSLYARTGNRWYIKQVIGGRGDGIPLSKEEQMAVDTAQSIHHTAQKKE